MRVPNVFGALIVFIGAITLDYVLAEPLYEWINQELTGNFALLCTMGLMVVIIFITIALPILIAVEDTEQIAG